MDRHDEERALRALIDGAGDERAATVVVERVVPRLTSFLRARYPALSPDDAHDVARDALLVALERRALFDPGRETRVATWLHGIAKVRALDFLRRRGRQVPLEESADEAAPRERTAPPDPQAGTRAADSKDGRLARTVRDAIAALPPQQRRAAEAHYLEGRPPRDVDEQYGWRPNTANVYLSHARRALRRRLLDAGYGTQTPRALAAYRVPGTRRVGGAVCRSRLRVRRLVLGVAA
ncbi:MAG TPA: RNA polymerase sigma factor [Chloroflexota bacterium]|jgi:RNA polymerase sigma-70 factor (ECF subfamily)|nr:RNA polymerase sigma factor [Chloroflexota bacterium]